MKHYPLGLLVLIAVALALSALAPYDRTTWWLEVFPILIGPLSWWLHIAAFL